VATTRAELGDRAFTAAAAAGRAIPPEEVAGAALAGAGPTARVEHAEEAPPTSTPVSPLPEPSPLTRREREVAALVARGLTDRQIAETLVITEGTVGVHLNNIFTKLDLHSRSQLAVWAAEHGLLTQASRRLAVGGQGLVLCGPPTAYRLPTRGARPIATVIGRAGARPVGRYDARVCRSPGAGPGKRAVSW
jgi:DNA-binding CsgD family transcriptional regulator